MEGFYGNINGEERAARVARERAADPLVTALAFAAIALGLVSTGLAITVAGIEESRCTVVSLEQGDRP